MDIDRKAERVYLERCMDSFMEHLDRGAFDAHMNEWTVFGGEPPKDPLGFYKKYSDAIGAGYTAYGLQPFMVSEITFGHKIFGRWGAPKIVRGRLMELTSKPSGVHPRSIIIR